MRERHFPRVCRSCSAPMARQEDTCWRCGTQWATEDAPRTALRVIQGGLPVAGVPHHRTPATVAGDARAGIQVRLDADRWTDEGGSPEPEPRLPAAAAGRR